jgi:heme A synthase
MYTAVQHLHSYWAYLVLLVVVLATFNALIKLIGKKPFGPQDFRISLFALITMHLQLLIGLVLYFVSPYFSAFSNEGMGEIMGDSTLRLYLIEHPLTMILAIVFITIGYSKHKKKLSSSKKFKTLSIFYTIALILLLSRIPWQAWF